MSKYNSRKTIVDGIEFDSRKEAKRYKELALLERAGKISGLELQKRYELIPAQYEEFERYGKRGQRLQNGRRCVEKAVYYIADFAYTDENGNQVVEDVKGYKGSTAYAVFALKRKSMLYFHNIKVKEI